VRRDHGERGVHRHGGRGDELGRRQGALSLKGLANRRAFAHHRVVTRRRSITIIGAAAGAALFLSPPAALSRLDAARTAHPAEEAAPVEAVFYNGTIYTMDVARPVVEALSVRNGRIAGAGSSADLLADCPPGAARIDLGGRAVIPGLTDAHAHFLGYAERSAWIQLRGARSLADAAAVVSARAGGAGSGWVLGRGWDQNDWPEPVYPGRAELDAAAGPVPAYLVRVCGHAAWVNTAALRLAGIGASTPDPPGGRIVRDAAGEPTGILLDNAMDLVSRLVPPFAAADKKRLLVEAAGRCLAAGLVGVHEMGVSAETVELYRELYAAGELPFRITAYIEGSDPGAGSMLDAGPPAPEFGERFSIVGVKFYADGSLGARSAALLSDYADDPGNRGIMVTAPETLYAAVLRCQERGFQTAVHAIGDAAVRAVLDAYERMGRERPSADRRHRIEHAQVVAPGDIPRFAALGVVPSMQFIHCTSDMSWAGARLGPVREEGAYAWRSLLDSCGRLPGGSDFPVEPIDPLLGIHAAATRMDLDGNPPGGWHPRQRLTVYEAVRSFTADAAWAAHREEIAGSLAPGRLADFVVLSEDIFAVEASAIPRIRVLATVLGGDIVYRSAGF
jgi:hypothetical protein